MTNTQSLGTIEATNPVLAVAPLKEETEMLRATDKITALYCRLSVEDLKENKKGGKEDESNSIQNQKMILLQYAKEHRFPNPTFFVDEGITGTSARKRPEFLRMIRQCKQGKIDIVLTKSISRFARNTVDCLNYVRALKELGIAVIFEKENMNTLEVDSEILITMLGAFAQSESESISANVRWGIRQAMKEGKATIQYKYLYGYRKGDDGKPEIIPDQAEVVRKIYDLFLSGTPVRGIQEYLNTSALPNINGEPKWARSAIDSILTNEKYCGDVLLQKTYIDDCINKKVKKNTGQLPMYLVQNHHEGIISRKTFDAAQAELARRSAGKSPSKKNAPTGRSRYSSKYALSDRLYCGECGTRYQRCTWRNRDGSKRIVWRCVSRVDYGNKYCHNSPTLDEEPLHRAILAAINSTVKGKDSIIYNLKSAMEKELAPVAGQQLSLSEIDSQLEQLNTEFSKALAEASESGDQAAYSDRFREIMQKQTALKVQRDEIQGMLAESGKAAAHIEQCRQAAETTPSAITEWDEALIRQVVESVTVETGSEIIVALKSGASIHQELVY